MNNVYMMEDAIPTDFNVGMTADVDNIGMNADSIQKIIWLVLFKRL